MSVRIASLALCSLVVALAGHAAAADIALRDDAGVVIRLAAPARRIVSLAPNITELLFAAGAGAQVVATVEYSDYPAKARALPRIGSYAQLDLERILALRPDLVIGWKSGNPAAQLDRIRALGLPLFLSELSRIEDVASGLEKFGRLAGTSSSAELAAADFRRRLNQISAQYAHRPKVRVFYEIWDRPLTTINGKQMISDVLRRCGGENVFAGLPALAPVVGIENVLAANPEAIIASGADASRPAWLDDWQHWPGLDAAKRDNLYYIDPDLMQRQTPRILDGAAQVCADLETVRAKRGKEF